MCFKHQNFHECAARVKILMFSTHEMKYILYLPEKILFFFFYTFYRLRIHAMSHPLKKGVLKMQKRKQLANPNTYVTKYSSRSN